MVHLGQHERTVLTGHRLLPGDGAGVGTQVTDVVGLFGLHIDEHPAAKAFVRIVSPGWAIEPFGRGTASV
ncbi:hypothetical protein GCM10017774_13630 [Lentzea cavernae]|uniref:Uncharacterized protein n=1 Tax=Lentzea cavernae TaxID=2020703 RepID=A0ABQ3M699_9PSEU|nr:hypothetical protein GCM10017774_13630 [Lentzea cavernae]